MKKVNLVLVLIISTIVNVIAQDEVYYTRNASLQIHGKFQGERIQGDTKKLAITLDYETSEIILNLNLENLIFDVDSLDNIIQANDQELSFTGILNLEHINTDEHLPLKFKMGGLVAIGNAEKKIEGKGELLHLGQSEDLACRLGLTFILNLNDFGIEIPNLEAEMEVVIKQTLLKTGKN